MRSPVKRQKRKTKPPAAAQKKKRPPPRPSASPKKPAKARQVSPAKRRPRPYHKKRSRRDQSGIILGSLNVGPPGDAVRACAWCRAHLTTIRGRFCSRKCRQSAFRLRLKGGPSSIRPTVIKGRPRRFAFADVSDDTAADALKALRDLQHFDGWGLVVDPGVLRKMLPLMGRRRFRLCAWVDDGSQFSDPPKGYKSGWSAVIVSTPDPRPGTLDAIAVPNGDGNGPILAFAAWLFAALGLRPGDELIELADYGGTGDVISNAWAELGRPVAVRKRRRPRPPGQKHTHAAPPEPPADPAPPAPPAVLDEMN